MVLFFAEYKRGAKPDLVVSGFYRELNITQSGISVFIPGTMASPIARNPSNRRLCAPFGVIGPPSNYSDCACLVFFFTEYKRGDKPDLVVSSFYRELNITKSGISVFIPGTMVSPIARNPSNRRLCAPFGVIGTPSNYSDCACFCLLYTSPSPRDS